MGAEESILRNYEIGKPYHIAPNKQESSPDQQSKAGADRGTAKVKAPRTSHKICVAFHRENGSAISILVFDRENQAQCNDGSNYAEVLRVMRHPSILKYIGIVESAKQTKILTEAVLPLHHCIDDLEDFEIISGLRNILEALIFLHEKGGLVHKNLCWASVFVSKQDEAWKLGGMDKVEKYSAEGINSDVQSFAEFALSVMTYVHNGVEERSFVRRLESCSRQGLLTDSIKKTTDNELLETADLKALLQENLFRQAYLEISNFMNCITVKDDSEKLLFFSTLAEKLRCLDPDIVARKFLSKFLSKIILAEPSAEKFFIPHLLAFEDGLESDAFLPILPVDLYREHCVPLLLDLLSSNETHVRLVLLKHLSLFVKAIEKETLEKDILPEILLGVRDENDAIVSATLHGLACLVPILGGRAVIGGERSKYFVDQLPKFSKRNQTEMCTFDQRTEAVSVCSSQPDMRLKRKEMMQTKKEERKKALEHKRLEQERKKKEILKLEVIGETSIASEVDKSRERTKEGDASENTVSNAGELEVPSIRHEGEDSEPDWEGFEAFSSQSESEEEPGCAQMKSTRSAENLLLVSKDSLTMENTKSSPKQHVNKSEAPDDRLPSRRALVLGRKRDKAANDEFHRDDSVDSTISKDSDQSAQRFVNSKGETDDPALTTGGTTTYSNRISSPINTTKSNSSRKGTKESKNIINKKLGEEFEFHIAVDKSKEPDFFADMMPDLSENNTVLIKSDLPNVSSKFKAFDANDEDTHGWGDEGWDDAIQ